MNVADTLLQALRERMLDESESLAGLLRKCLLLGAETGSEALRDWARKELNGYSESDEVPEYRKVRGMPIQYNSLSGRFHATGQTIDRMQLPKEAWDYVPDELPFTQPVEELEELARQKSLSFASPRLTFAESVWNERLGPFQQVMALHYTMAGSRVAGMLGQIRTRLVDLIAELTASTPLEELPGKDTVDAAVHERIGDVYNTTIQQTGGALAIGAHAEAESTGLSVDDALRLLSEVRRVAADVGAEERCAIEQAVDDLEGILGQDEPDTGEVVRKVGKLQAAAQKIGILAVTAATTTAVQTLTDMALKGAFH